MKKNTQQYQNPTVAVTFKTVTAICTYGYLARWTWSINKYIGLSNKIISVILGLICVRGAFRGTWVNFISAIFALSACGYAVKWLLIFDYFGFVCKIMSAIFSYLCIVNVLKLMRMHGQ